MDATLACIQVVLGPVLLGAVLNQTCPKQVAKTAPYTPLLAVIAVALICGGIIAAGASAVRYDHPVSV